MSDEEVDILSMTDEEIDRIITGIKTVAAYNIEKKEISDAVTETMKDLKESFTALETKQKGYVGKIVRKAATIYANRKEDYFSNETAVIEQLLHKANKTSVEPEEE